MQAVFRIHCEICQHPFWVPPDLADQRTKCPGCKHETRVPVTGNVDCPYPNCGKSNIVALSDRKGTLTRLTCWFCKKTSTVETQPASIVETVPLTSAQPSVPAPTARAIRPWMYGAVGGVLPLMIIVGVVAWRLWSSPNNTPPASTSDIVRDIQPGLPPAVANFPPPKKTNDNVSLTNGPITPLPPSVKEPNSDLDFVPANARAVISLRVADLWNSKPIQEAWNKIPEFIRKQQEGVNDAFQFSMTDYERVTVVMHDPLNQSFWAVLKTTVPFSAAKKEKILAAAKNINWDRRSHRKVEYYYLTVTPGAGERLEPLAVYQAADDIIVAGTEVGVKAALDHFLSEHKTGDLAHLLPMIKAGQHHVLIGAVLTDDDRAEMVKLAKANPGVKVPQSVKSTLIKARLDTVVALEMRQTFQDTKEAEAIGEQFDQAKRLGQFILPAAGLMDEKSAKLMRMMTDFSVKREGADLVINANINLAKLAPEVPELLGNTIRFEYDTRSGAERLTKLVDALNRYHDVNNHYPPAVVYSEDGKTPLYSWRVALLPHLDDPKAKQLYKEFVKTKPWNDPENEKLLSRMPEIFVHPGVRFHPEQKEFASKVTCFQLLTGHDTAFGGNRKPTRADIRDGLDNTILLVESKDLVEWSKPKDVEIPATAAELKKSNVLIGKFGMYPIDTFPVALFNGRVLHLQRSINPQTFLDAVNPKDGKGLFAKE
jgi:hypothetical protein